MHTTIYKVDKQGFTVQHRELYSISYNKVYIYIHIKKEINKIKTKKETNRKSMKLKACSLIR